MWKESGAFENRSQKQSELRTVNLNRCILRKVFITAG